MSDCAPLVSPYPFQSRRFGEQLFIGGVLPISPEGTLRGAGDIEAQTHAVFRNLHVALKSAGLEMSDLVRLNTYYVFEGYESDATLYWEKMTRVRLQYLPNPGPAATAVRVRGMGRSGALIQLEAEAFAAPAAQRQRIMPSKSWDWSIPVPLSQGWKIGSQVWVGGQVSADMAGKAVSIGDLPGQTHNVLEHIRHVLLDAGAGFADLTQLKVCYLHDGDAHAAEQRLQEIMKVIRDICGETLPPVTAFGISLLYEGLLLEIDATAHVGLASKALQTRASNRNWAAEHQVLRTGSHIQIAGLSARYKALEPACEDVVNQLALKLEAVGSSPTALAHLHVFIAGDEANDAPEHAMSLFAAALKQLCGESLPPFTVVRVNGLPRGVPLQVDAVAVDLVKQLQP
ncbi:RidA family protein [Metapseudomonas boanensis]|uniref:RidA family protein n=1 Tax=Metapseudomonas boanensis TaxID=2822138 RepID=A0ABS5XNS3_9GAMM|nr:RidA family protein [Pseudomonas boanensis]MBT8769351.1 RidA family protein [Pseudomonas boanensis]